MLLCLDELDRNNIAHRDIKPENLMLDKGQIKMIDFGFACLYDNCHGKRGTCHFLPPEHYILDEIDDWHKIDVFSFGITIIFLLTDGLSFYEGLFDSYHEAESFFKQETIANLKILFADRLKNLALKYDFLNRYTNLISHMIELDYTDRWDATQCLDWFEENNT